MKNLSDYRLWVGIALIALCVGGGAWLFSLVSVTQTAYRFQADLPAGHVLTGSDLTPIEVNLAPLGQIYASEVPPEGSILKRSAMKGELLVAGTFTDKAEVGTATVVVNLANPVPSGVKVGSSIELWSLPDSRTNAGGAAEKVASGAQVSNFLAEDSLLGKSQPRLEVRVRQEDLAQVLTWISQGNSLMAVYP